MTYIVESPALAADGPTLREKVAWNHREFGIRLSLPPGKPPFPSVVLVSSPASLYEQYQTGFFLHRIPEAGIATAVFEIISPSVPGNPDTIEVDLLEGLEAAFHWVHKHEDLDQDRIGIAACGFGAAIAARAIGRHLVRPAALVLLGPAVERCGLVGIHVPSLVIMGATDELLPTVRAAADHSETTTVIVLPEGGHVFESRNALQQSADLATGWFAGQFDCGEDHSWDPDTGVGD
jgi:dienelactone hydrolase